MTSYNYEFLIAYKWDDDFSQEPLVFRGREGNSENLCWDFMDRSENLTLWSAGKKVAFRCNERFDKSPHGAPATGLIVSINKRKIEGIFHHSFYGDL